MVARGAQNCARSPKRTPGVVPPKRPASLRSKRTARWRAWGIVLVASQPPRIQVNSIEPSPVGEASRGGRVVLSDDALKRGDRLRVWLQFQVNPTNVGHRSYGVELDDAERPVTRIARKITVLP